MALGEAAIPTFFLTQGSFLKPQHISAASRKTTISFAATASQALNYALCQTMSRLSLKQVPTSSISPITFKIESSHFSRKNKMSTDIVSLPWSPFNLLLPTMFHPGSLLGSQACPGHFLPSHSNGSYLYKCLILCHCMDSSFLSLRFCKVLN